MLAIHRDMLRRQHVFSQSVMGSLSPMMSLWAVLSYISWKAYSSGWCPATLVMSQHYFTCTRDCTLCWLLMVAWAHQSGSEWAPIPPKFEHKKLPTAASCLRCPASDCTGHGRRRLHIPTEIRLCRSWMVIARPATGRSTSKSTSSFLPTSNLELTANCKHHQCFDC